MNSTIITKAQFDEYMQYWDAPTDHLPHTSQVRIERVSTVSNGTCRMKKRPHYESESYRADVMLVHELHTRGY